ncbi:MAG: hypothetical protein ACPGTU_00795 [Myxococcota bacterium]
MACDADEFSFKGYLVGIRHAGWLMMALVVACSEYKLESALDADGALDTGRDTRTDADGDDTAAPSSYDGAITGRICDPAGGGWIVGAYVYTMIDTDGDGEGDTKVEDSTDESGRYRLAGLPIYRDYQVVAVKGSFTASYEVSVGEGTTEIPDDECALDPPNIAVVTGDFDHIEDIIDDMGLEYTEFTGTGGSTRYRDFLTDSAAMSEYDIIFLNCGASTDWLTTHREEIRGNLRGFVEAGGSVYASDWAYYFVELPFPGKIDFYGDDSTAGDAQYGWLGMVTANVVDPVMQAIVGSTTASINFDLSSWAISESLAPDVDVLLQANVEAMDLWGGTTVIPNAPIAARFDIGAGRVIYTAFHNEHQGTTIDMREILEEIILSL